MRALFGVVSLLVALAIVGFVAVRQLKAVRTPVVPVSDTAVPGLAGAAVPPVAASGNVREQSQQIQQKVQDDVAKALERGAAARAESADK